MARPAGAAVPGDRCRGRATSGLRASRKFDCEAWIPTQGKYRELTSTSNCTDFQARRLDIRARSARTARPLATLNGTLCAIPRTIIALLENHQQADGSVRVPAALQPYLGGREVLEPVRPGNLVTPFTPGLVALDIDGTLLHADGHISPPVREAVRRAADAGVHIVLSTGRARSARRTVLEQLELADGLVVASNGAVTFSYWPVHVLPSVTFDARETVKLLLEHVPDAGVAVEVVASGYRLNKSFPEGEITGEMGLQSVDELVAEPVTRVIVRDPSQSAEEFVELAERLGLHGTNYSVGYTAWLDLAPEGVSKASALAEVADRLGVPQSQVLAIGDGRNDVEMLRWAGRGVAMGGSPLAVQESADDVTEDVHRDGVALELDRYFR